MSRYRFASAFMSLFCISSLATAAEVSLEKARPAAQNWLSSTSKVLKVANRGSYRIAQEEVIQAGGKTLGYNFILAPAGHIIVPARDELPAVKLYSLTTTLSTATSSEVADLIKEILSNTIKKLDDHPAELAQADRGPNNRLWARFGVPAAVFAQQEAAPAPMAGDAPPTLVIGPLLDTTWNQWSPYNLMTPLWYDGQTTPTGCTATSAAQIMKYWNWPATGQGSTSYTWNNGSIDITLSANFAASTYDWANMLNNYTGGETTSQRNAVAKLMSDVGIAFHMNYRPTGSGAWVAGNHSVYPTYFRYQNTAQTVARMSYASDSAWMQVFKNEVSHLRPSHMQMATTSESPNVGHAVVVDGYMNNPSEMIHINMGWSGSYDGWYVSNNITGSGHLFDDMAYMQAIIGIEPNTQTNLAPVVYAGPDQTVTLPAAASLAGTASDDGLPNPPGSLTITWSKVSGPGTVTFANPSQPVTTATFSSAGTYVLRLTANDSALSTSDDVTITVNGANPCAGLCNNPVVFTIAPYGSYQSGNLGTGNVCRETMSNVVGGNCGNFASPRILTVNGTTMVCNNQNWSFIPAKRNGGYCIQTTSGNWPWAFFTAW